jgi:hypothetical protein
MFIKEKVLSIVKINIIFQLTKKLVYVGFLIIIFFAFKKPMPTLAANLIKDQTNNSNFPGTLSLVFDQTKQ